MLYEHGYSSDISKCYLRVLVDSLTCMYVLLYLTSYVVVEEERTSVCTLLSTRYVMYYVMLLGTNTIIINQGL